MTEFELATLALREYAIWASIGVGLGQVLIVWYGIRAMNRSSGERANDRKEHSRSLETLIRQSNTNIRQSDANVQALKELLTRPAAPAT